METRRNKRIMINLKAELFLGDARHACFIENMSETGIYIVTAPTKSSLDFAPESAFELRFKIPSGDKLNLQCSVIWSFPTPPHGYTNSIGLEIKDPPLTYLEALKEL
jgi:hypothetical protein